MSLHKVYCSNCHEHVQVSLAGHVYEFMDWPIDCPCEHKDAVVIKKIFNEYGLFSICDLEPSTEIIQEILRIQNKDSLKI